MSVMAARYRTTRPPTRPACGFAEVVPRARVGDNAFMRSAARALVGVLAAATLVALTGCSTAPRSEPAAADPSAIVPSPTSAPSISTLGTAADPVRVAIVGDSLTAGGGRMLSQGLDANTWMTYAKGDGIDYVGGWAKGGTTVQIMAENVRPLPDVDVLVLMAGTNDVRRHIPFDRSAASYQRIVDVVHPKHVIIGALPPYDRNPQAAASYERQLEKYVHDKGWHLVDPWGFARDGLVFAQGTTRDGIHPTTAGYRKVGLAYRAAILGLVAEPVTG